MENNKNKEDFESYIKVSRQASEIVDEGIKNPDDFEKLEKLASDVACNETYIFEHDKTNIYNWIIRFNVILSICFFIFLIIGIVVSIYSGNYRIYGFVTAGISVFMIVFNLLRTRKTVDRLRFFKRYDQYAAVLKNKKFILTEDLIAYTNQTMDIIVKDLNEAVELKLIPEGHFGSNQVVFFLNDESYNNYLKKQAAADRYFTKLIEEKRRRRDRPEEIKEILNRGEKYVKDIHGYNDLIKDEELSQKLDRMEQIVTTILRELDLKPDQANTLDMMLYYYFPSAKKLLKQYIEIDEKETLGESLKLEQKKLVDAIDSLNEVYESVLDAFYNDIELKVDTEINAMEDMIQQDKAQRGLV